LRLLKKFIVAGDRMSEKSGLIQELEALQKKAEAELKGIQDTATLQSWRATFLSRSSDVMAIFKRLPEAPKEERPEIGQFANQVKSALEAQFEKKENSIKQAELEANLQNERLDVTLPGREPARGRLHIQTLVLREI